MRFDNLDFRPFTYYSRYHFFNRDTSYDVYVKFKFMQACDLANLPLNNMSHP